MLDGYDIVNYRLDIYHCYVSSLSYHFIFEPVNSNVKSINFTNKLSKNNE